MEGRQLTHWNIWEYESSKCIWDAGIRQLSEEEKQIEVIYQKVQENYEEGIEFL